MKVLLLDAHDRIFPGICKNGLNEHQESIKINNHISTYLMEDGVDVLRYNADYQLLSSSKSSLRNKVSTINYLINHHIFLPDVVVECHFNGFHLPSVSGFKTLYFEEESKRVAEYIQKGMKWLMKDHKDRKIKKRKNLFLLTESISPAIIIEPIFISNKRECDFLQKNREYLAYMIAWGIKKGIQNPLSP